jgi:hypothetical protein
MHILIDAEEGDNIPNDAIARSAFATKQSSFFAL